MPAREKPPYPWRETATCRRCGYGYVADYTQERDWSYCPDCTGEAGRPARAIYDPKTNRLAYVYDPASKTFVPAT